MPFPVQVILWTAAAVTAIGVIWKAIAKPLVLAAIETQVTLPVVRAVVAQFRGSDLDKLSVLSDIAENFPHNGSSLPSSLARIEKDLADLRAEMKTNAGVNREQMAHVAARTDRIDAATLRVEAAAGLAATAAAKVATRLAKAEERADEVNGVPGEASDAAAKSGDE